MSTLPHKSPPKWANRFLEWYCASDLVDEIQGDLLEAFYDRSRAFGDAKAKWWFVWDVLRFFRPSSFGKGQYNSNNIAMLKNYLKVSFRNFAKNKVYSSINLSGLVVGITACLLITLHIIEELSYDNFHPNADRVYRVVMDMYGKSELNLRSVPVFAAVGPNLKKDFPEVEDAMRILPFGEGVYSVRQEDGSLIRFNEEKAVLADSAFFHMMGFKLLDGDPRDVLSGSQQIVISESTASKYFGDENPVGKTIIWRGTREATVTGVFEDFPENSHMDFDLITSTKSWNGYENWIENWGWYDFYTFIRLSENTNLPAFEAKLREYLKEKKAEIYSRNESHEELWLQPIQDIHLHSTGMSWDMGENGGADNIYFLAAIAGLILIIAWVNFINLSTARAVKRAKEVGIRKVVGAAKSQLVFQFISEAFLYNLFGVLLSVGIVLLVIPGINDLLEISLERQLLLSTVVLLGLVSLVLLGTVISGLYPAFVLTSFKAVLVVKGNLYQRKKRFGFRQVLVIFQFTASVTLILGTFLIVKQLQYMRSQDLGFSTEQTLVLRAATSSRGQNDLVDRLSVFKTNVSQLPVVKGYSVTNNVPGVENFGISGFHSKHYLNEPRNLYRVYTDEFFFPNFDIELLAGRNFMKEMATDTAAVLLNEVAAKYMGFNSPEEAVGEKLNPNSDRNQWNIIGVVANYHQASLREELDPIAFFYRPDRGNYYAIKLATDNFRQAVSEVEAVWDKVFPDNPFDFFFMDEFFDRQYKADQQFNSVFIGFAGLAIFVACLGLFGLVSFTAEQSKKEISIRKVLGASAGRVVLLLARDYARLIAVSLVIAFPLGYYLMQQWLQSFAYQTDIGAGIFLSGAVIITLIALVTVSFKSFGVANSNPVNALRDE